MKKTLFIALGALVVLIGLMTWGRAVARQSDTPADMAESSTSSALMASEMRYDFGTISMKDGFVEHRFSVTNDTDSAVIIKSVSTSCMCTNAYLESSAGEKGPFGMQGMGYIPPADETVQPGESRSIRVVFDPNAHGPAGVGLIERAVEVVDTDGKVLTLGIKGVVTP